MNPTGNQKDINQKERSRMQELLKPEDTVSINGSIYREMVDSFTIPFLVTEDIEIIKEDK